jgi:NADH:ubiquinone oxidoreductase subunit E
MDEHLFLKKKEVSLMSGKSKDSKKAVTRDITPDEWKKIHAIIEKYKDKPGHLIPALKEAQELVGFLPREVQERLGEGLNISPSYIYGVVTFYAFFTMVPRGRNVIRACLGTACYVKGAPKVVEKIQSALNIDVGGTTEDMKFGLEVVRCLGACSLAPIIMIGDNVHADVEAGQVEKILNQYS